MIRAYLRLRCSVPLVKGPSQGGSSLLQEDYEMFAYFVQPLANFEHLVQEIRCHCIRPAVLSKTIGLIRVLYIVNFDLCESFFDDNCGFTL